MSKELLVTLLDYEFYDRYKHKIDDKLFHDATAKDLLKTIQNYYAEHHESLTLESLRALYFAGNPALSTAYKRSCDELFKELGTVEISKSVQEDILKKAIACSKWTEISYLALEGAENRTVDKQKVLELLDLLDVDLKAATREYVTADIKTLLANKKKALAWKIHHAVIGEKVGGVGPAVFGLIAARPNAGKTAFICSLMFHPEGFCAQGAKVHLIGNEEPAERTMLRGISCYTGLMESELEDESNQEYAAKKFAELQGHYFVLDEVGMSLTELEEYVKMNKDNLDILIVDQLDKIRIDGEYKREDLRIRALYTYSREIAKRYGICILGVCQASADAEGKLYYGFECLEGSKTGKAAEVDLCITIGKNPIAQSSDGNGDTGERVANIVKNKLTGREVSVHYMLNPMLSRIQE